MAFSYNNEGEQQPQAPRSSGKGRGFRFTPRFLILGILAVVVIIMLSTGFFVVDQTEQAVILRLGKYLKTVGPGLQFKIPFGIDKSYSVETQTVQTMSFGYRATSAGNLSGSSTKYSYSKYMDESTMLTGDIMTSERTSMEVEAQEKLQASLDSYGMGVKIVTVKLQDIVPPAGDVQDAFEDVNKAIQDMNKYINEGKENYNRVIPAAEGEASKVIQEAQGYASERVNTATGDVARFRSVLSEYEKSPDITARRLYIETMESVLAAGGNLTVIDKNLESFLPLMNITKEGK